MTWTFTPSNSPTIRSGARAAADRIRVARPTGEPVFVMPRDVEAAISAHAVSSRREVAGILAGRVWADQDGSAVVSIEAAIRAEKHVETTAVHVTFKPEAWNAIAAELDALGDDYVAVGWYHTHPNLGAFFSGTDLATQASAFRHPWQIGIVIDPVQRERLAFRGARSVPVRPEQVVTPSVTPVAEVPPEAADVRQARLSWPAIATAAACSVMLLVAIRRYKRRTQRQLRHGWDWGR